MSWTNPGNIAPILHHPRRVFSGKPNCLRHLLLARQAVRSSMEVWWGEYKRTLTNLFSPGGVSLTSWKGKFAGTSIGMSSSWTSIVCQPRSSIPIRKCLFPEREHAILFLGLHPCRSGECLAFSINCFLFLVFSHSWPLPHRGFLTTVGNRHPCVHMHMYLKTYIHQYT